MMRLLLATALMLAALTAMPRVKTTRGSLTQGRALEADTSSLAAAGNDERQVPGDSVAVMTVAPGDITLRGYSKRPTDTKESVMVTNNTPYTVAAVHLHLTYRTMAGEVFNERDVTVRVPPLEPGKTVVTEFRSFDTHHEFYYYGSGKPRKTATPYDVSYTLLGYDITIGRRTR